jgi:hypothetical protein
MNVCIAEADIYLNIAVGASPQSLTITIVVAKALRPSISSIRFGGMVSHIHYMN